MKTKNMIVILLFVIAIQGENVFWVSAALTVSLAIYLTAMLVRAYRKHWNKKTEKSKDGVA